MIFVLKMLNRIVLFFIFLGIFSASFAIGAEVQVSEEESAIILEEFETLLDEIDAVGIFTHNTLLSLPMFIPGFGSCVGCICSILYWNGFFSAKGCQSDARKRPLPDNPIHVTIWIDGSCSLFDSNVPQLYDRPQDDQKDANTPRLPRNCARDWNSHWTATDRRVCRILLY